MTRWIAPSFSRSVIFGPSVVQPSPSERQRVFMSGSLSRRPPLAHRHSRVHSTHALSDCLIHARARWPMGPGIANFANSCRCPRARIELGDTWFRPSGLTPDPGRLIGSHLPMRESDFARVRRRDDPPVRDQVRLLSVAPGRVGSRSSRPRPCARVRTDCRCRRRSADRPGASVGSWSSCGDPGRRRIHSASCESNQWECRGRALSWCALCRLARKSFAAVVRWTCLTRRSSADDCRTTRPARTRSSMRRLVAAGERSIASATSRIVGAPRRTM